MTIENCSFVTTEFIIRDAIGTLLPKQISINI